jgi:Domain of unknown function (DUF4185)
MYIYFTAELHDYPAFERKTMRKLYENHALTAIILITSLLLLPLVGETSETREPSIEVISAEPTPAFEKIFFPQKRGWLGADGATSVLIDDKKSVWLFGDTLVGNLSSKGERKGIMPRNTIAIHDFSQGLPGKAGFHWGFSDNITESFFLGGDYDLDYWYWPTAGILIDDELYIFNYKVHSTGGMGGFSFGFGEMTLIRVSNPYDPPAKWKMETTGLGIGNDHQYFCSAVYAEKQYLYMYGFDDGPVVGEFNRKMVLARIKIDDLKKGAKAENFQYYVESKYGLQWGSEPENLVPLFSPGTTENSIHYDALLHKYVMFTQHAFKAEVYIVTSPALTGPWSEPLQVYTIPDIEAETLHAYAVKAHPELSTKPGEIVFTYIVNTTDFWSMFNDLKIYYPRFVRVQLGITE